MRINKIFAYFFSYFGISTYHKKTSNLIGANKKGELFSSPFKNRETISIILQ